MSSEVSAMHLHRLVWAYLLCCAVACGSTDPVVGSDPTGEQRADSGDSNRRPDSGRSDSGSSDDDEPDSSTATDAGKPAKDSGFTECADTRVDAEPKPGSVNVVWVIDTSGSMDQEATQVQQNMNLFAQQISEAGLEDYRVVVVSKRDFISVPDPLGSDNTHFLHIEQSVGSSEPLKQLLARFPDYKNFLLADALTHFVAVTDDESSVSASEWRSTMQTNLGNDNFVLNAIASPPGESSISFLGITIGACTGPFGSAARPGDEYWAAAMATKGLTFSICSGDWSALVGQLAAAVSKSAAVPCALELPASPQGQSLDFDTVNVVLGTRALPRVANPDACGTKAGWYYDAPGAPTGIQLCPSSCDAAKNGGSLQVALGCTTIIQ